MIGVKGFSVIIGGNILRTPPRLSHWVKAYWNKKKQGNLSYQIDKLTEAIINRKFDQKPMVDNPLTNYPILNDAQTELKIPIPLFNVTIRR